MVVRIVAITIIEKGSLIVTAVFVVIVNLVIAVVVNAVVNFR